MTIEDITEDLPEVLDERAAFFEEQAHVIGSTDAAAILGLSKRATPLSVWRRLTGATKTDKPSLPGWLGQRIEGVVAELYIAATGNPVRADNLQHLHPIHPFIGCHLDRRVVGDPRTIVELKTRSRMTGWGEDGSSVIPPDIYAQVQQQMLVTAAREVHVAVLFGLGHDFRVYRIPRDDEFLALLLPKLIQFWEMYVETGIAPPATGHEVDTEAVSQGPGGAGGVAKAATPEQEMLVANLRLARLNYAQAKLAKDQWENRIRQVIGTADGLRGSFGVIWYKRSKRSKQVEWEYVAKVYRGAFDALYELIAGQPEQEVAILRDEVDAAETLYTTWKDGTRRLRVELREEP